ncbi:unnamed protein product, partial [marine sediment metagenome]
GKGKKMIGKKGKDVYIHVPLGVVVINGDRILGEILTHDQILLAAKGGKGGRGNYHFLTFTNQSPP